MADLALSSAISAAIPAAAVATTVTVAAGTATAAIAVSVAVIATAVAAAATVSTAVAVASGAAAAAVSTAAIAAAVATTVSVASGTATAAIAIAVAVVAIAVPAAIAIAAIQQATGRVATVSVGLLCSRNGAWRARKLGYLASSARCRCNCVSGAAIDHDRSKLTVGLANKRPVGEDTINQKCTYFDDLTTSISFDPVDQA